MRFVARCRPPTSRCTARPAAARSARCSSPRWSWSCAGPRSRWRIRRRRVPDDVDLHALLTVQLQTWRDVAAIHDKTLTLEPGPGTALVHADALRLGQALSNVVANAIEHGGRQIVIRTVHAGDRIRVEVTDGGPGLPASVAELARRPRAGRGARGRGLAITRAVLAHCGGRIFALSTAPGVAIDLPLDSRSA